ncbi:MAG: hypothetical protein Q9221_002666 [Calogaya cf. arnoldii]
MALLLPSLVTGICLILTYHIYRYLQYFYFARSNGCLPPKRYPHKDPFLGLDFFLETGKIFSENRYLPELVARYNTYGPTFQTNLFGTPSVNTIEPKNLQAVYSSNSKDWGIEPLRLPAQDPFCGRGFITTDGAAWEHSRALLKPGFNRANIVAGLEGLGKALDKMMDKIPSDGGTVDLQALFFDLYLDTSTEFLFGESFGALSNSTSKDSHAFMEAFNHAMFGSGFRIALGPFKFLYQNAKWQEACKTTHAFADKYVQKALEYRQSVFSGSSLINDKNNINMDESRFPTRSKPLLYHLALQTSSPLTLRNEILQVLMAAEGTTAALLSNVFFLLARHPSIYEKLRQEVLALGGEEPDFDRLSHMKYLQNVLKETTISDQPPHASALRLHPIIPQMNRIALAPTTLPLGGGPNLDHPIYISRGTIFDTSSHVLHRAPSIWGTDAEIFNPERWDETGMSETALRWQYMPFGAGPRACVGKYKALGETAFVVTRMVRRFGVVESRDSREWQGRVMLTSRNLWGCKVGMRA